MLGGHPSMPTTLSTLYLSGHLAASDRNRSWLTIRKGTYKEVIRYHRINKNFEKELQKLGRNQERLNCRRQPPR